jgi:hypothetical protein
VGFAFFQAARCPTQAVGQHRRLLLPFDDEPGDFVAVLGNTDAGHGHSTLRGENVRRPPLAVLPGHARESATEVRQLGTLIDLNINNLDKVISSIA